MTDDMKDLVARASAAFDALVRSGRISWISWGDHTNKETEMKIETIARACHEANRAITAHVKDVPVQPPWSETPEDMQQSCIRGVEFAIRNPGATAEDQHNAWLLERTEQGWTLGAFKNDEAKTHPALRPYDELPDGVKLKDNVFRAIVRALRAEAYVDDAGSDAHDES